MNKIIRVLDRGYRVKPSWSNSNSPRVLVLALHLLQHPLCPVFNHKILPTQFPHDSKQIPEPSRTHTDHLDARRAKFIKPRTLRHMSDPTPGDGSDGEQHQKSFHRLARATSELYGCSGDTY